MKCIICKSEFNLKRRLKHRANKFCSLKCYWVFKKGRTLPHLIGYRHSEETIDKIKQAVALHPSTGHTGKKHSYKSKRQMRKAHLGKKLSDEHKKKIVAKLTGRPVSKETRDKLRKMFSGINGPGWIDGNWAENIKIRWNKKSREWADKVKKRDGKCVICKSLKQLEADHIKSWRDYPLLRYRLSNGRTLCRECHFITFNWGRKAVKLK